MENLKDIKDIESGDIRHLVEIDGSLNEVEPVTDKELQEASKEGYNVSLDPPCGRQICFRTYVWVLRPNGLGGCYWYKTRVRCRQ